MSLPSLPKYRKLKKSSKTSESQSNIFVMPVCSSKKAFGRNIASNTVDLVIRTILWAGNSLSSTRRITSQLSSSSERFLKFSVSASNSGNKNTKDLVRKNLSFFSNYCSYTEKVHKFCYHKRILFFNTLRVSFLVFYYRLPKYTYHFIQGIPEHRVQISRGSRERL